MYNGGVILKIAAWCLLGALIAAGVGFNGSTELVADIGRFVFFNLIGVAVVLMILGMYIGRTH
jgi:hypothetical protein